MTQENFEGKKSYGREEDGEEHALIEYSEFKGNKVISLRRTPTDQYPWTFGVSKAKLFFDNIQAIEKFVQDNAKK